MTPRRTSAVLAALASPAAAVAQIVTTQSSTVTFSLAWHESDANGAPLPNPNGTLEPGEHALLQLTVSFTNQNTIGAFSPPVGTFTSGTIRGLCAGFFDLLGTGSAAGSWFLDHAVDPVWDVVGPPGWGTPTPAGDRLQNIQFGQFPMTPAAIITTNPILNIWHGVWTPTSYVSRTVRFACSEPASPAPNSAVLFETSPTTLVSAFSLTSFGSVSIPVVPVPASLLCLLPLLAPRRRRPAPKVAHP
jgi:hypothetical protein